MTDHGGGSGSRPIYSIGAVATMLGVETATLRAWEERYGVVVPPERWRAADLLARRPGALAVRRRPMQTGTTAADAHRLLAEHLGETERF